MNSQKEICKCNTCLIINPNGRILSKRIKRQYEKAKKYIYDKNGIIIRKVYSKKKRVNKSNNRKKSQYNEQQNLEYKNLEYENLELEQFGNLEQNNCLEQYEDLEYNDKCLELYNDELINYDLDNHNLAQDIE
ncbi:4028_t:CDS:1, partial [Racocetra fulgida]